MNIDSELIIAIVITSSIVGVWAFLIRLHLRDIDKGLVITIVVWSAVIFFIIYPLLLRLRG